MSKRHAPTPNDQRSTVKNPTSPAFQNDRQNRIGQGHPAPPPPRILPSAPPKKP